MNTKQVIVNRKHNTSNKIWGSKRKTEENPENLPISNRIKNYYMGVYQANGDSKRIDTNNEGKIHSSTKLKKEKISKKSTKKYTTVIVTPKEDAK